MSESALHELLTWLVLGIAPLIAVFLLFVAAPYGRHARSGWGPSVPNRLGWVLMESPSCLGFFAVYALGGNALAGVPIVLCSLWQVHYINRTFIFPFRLSSHGKRMPIAVVLMGVVFNGINAYINARWISHLGDYPISGLTDPLFLCGVALFFFGLATNLRADATLLALRRSSEGYQIPRGGLYRWISCPNYFGEWLEWLGWALATMSLPGAAFALFTFANLFPRALANHRWYQERFPDYPSRRRAFLPFLV